MVLEVLVRQCGGVWLGGDFASKERVGGRLTASPREVQFVQKEYRVTHQNGKNLLLTEFRQVCQLVDHNCSYLLPRQDGGMSQI